MAGNDFSALMNILIIIINGKIVVKYLIIKQSFFDELEFICYNKNICYM